MLSGSSALSLRRFGAWGGRLEGPCLAGSSVPLSGHMGESWAGILAYGGPERCSACGFGLGSLSCPWFQGPKKEGDGSLDSKVLGKLWKTWSRQGGGICIGKSFPLFPASGKSLGT